MPPLACRAGTQHTPFERSSLQVVWSAPIKFKKRNTHEKLMDVSIDVETDTPCGRDGDDVTIVTDAG